MSNLVCVYKNFALHLNAFEFNFELSTQLELMLCEATCIFTIELFYQFQAKWVTLDFLYQHKNWWNFWKLGRSILEIEAKKEVHVQNCPCYVNFFLGLSAHLRVAWAEKLCHAPSARPHPTHLTHASSPSCCSSSHKRLLPLPLLSSQPSHEGITHIFSPNPPPPHRSSSEDQRRTTMASSSTTSTTPSSPET
jgi:hypothetical protein